MGEGYFQMVSEKDRKIEVTDSMAEALDKCLWLFEQHGVTRPAKWWKGYPTRRVEDGGGTSYVRCTFWIGKSPDNLYDMDVVLKRRYNDDGNAVWRVTMIEGHAERLTGDGRSKVWKFNIMTGELQEDCKLIQIPYLMNQAE
jgi:hypothetical protein